MTSVGRGSVAVTPRSLSMGGHPALDRIEKAGFTVVFPSPGKAPTLEEQMAVLPGCVGYLAGVERIEAGLIEACPQLRVISRNGVGVDAIDLGAAARCGVQVVNAPSANAQGVAELTLALILSSVRSVAWSDAGLKAGDWRRRQGFELAGRTLGVIGCGNVGRRVALMGVGLGMSVLGVDEYEHPKLLEARGFTYTDLRQLLAVSDVVTLHCPPTAHPLIGTAELSLLPPHAHLVNTARAGLVDDDAVVSALNDGALAGYATDVFAEEPPPMSALIGHPRVTVTPHVGGYTQESVDRATNEAVDNLLAVLEAE